MNYRVLGRTGLKVSVLGFGCMRLPMNQKKQVDDEKTIPLLRRAVELGVNYFDSAVFYCNNDSQRLVGDALHDLRGQILLSTKNHYYGDADGWWRNLENSLRLMRTDYLDVYHFHAMSWERYLQIVKPKDGLLAAMLKARDQGLIRHLAYSCHDTAQNNIKIAEEGVFESALMQYNLLDRGNEPAIARLHELGMGVTIMGSVGGGRLAGQNLAAVEGGQGMASAQEALRFVLSNPAVSMALSGMSTIEMLEQNVAAASQDLLLSAEESAVVASAAARHEKILELYCTSCGYCMPCPAEVNIPENFTLAHLDRAYGMTDLARKNYAKLQGQARYCLQCGKCLDKCPQKLRIPEQLEQIVQRLDSDLGQLVLEAHPASATPVEEGMEFEFSIAAVNLGAEPITGQVTFDLAGQTLLEQAVALKPRKHRRFHLKQLVRPRDVRGEVHYRAVFEGVAGAPEVTRDYPLLFAHRITAEERAIADQAYVCGPKRLASGRAELCPTHRFGFRVGHDGENLIVLAEVEDDHLFDADGIEVFFDCRTNGERNGPYEAGCGYVRLIAGENPRLEEKNVIGLDFSGSTVTAINHQGRYSLKAKIPLAGLLAPGQHLVGFDIQQVSHDSAGQVDLILGWHGDERSRKVTWVFGMLFVE